jgi:hypothetical protein
MLSKYELLAPTIFFLLITILFAYIMRYIFFFTKNIGAHKNIFDIVLYFSFSVLIDYRIQWIILLGS